MLRLCGHITFCLLGEDTLFPFRLKKPYGGKKGLTRIATHLIITFAVTSPKTTHDFLFF